MAAGLTAETFVARGSSNIDQFTYDPESQSLTVTFRDGRSWQYDRVDAETVGAWQRAGGSGKFFYAVIRSAYEGREV